MSDETSMTSWTYGSDALLSQLRVGEKATTELRSRSTEVQGHLHVVHSYCDFLLHKLHHSYKALGNT